MQSTDLRPDTEGQNVSSIIAQYKSEGHLFRSDPRTYRLLHHIERYWHAADMIERHLGRSPAKVIDMGCGVGIGLEQLAARSSLELELTGVEMDVEACNKAAAIGTMRMFNCRIDEFKAVERYDAVLCFEVVGFDTFSSDSALLSLLRNCCSSEGLMCVSVPNYRGRAKKGYFERTYSLQEFRALLGDSFPDSSDITIYGQLYPTNRRASSDVGVQLVDDLSAEPDFCVGVIRLC